MSERFWAEVRPPAGVAGRRARRSLRGDVRPVAPWEASIIDFLAASLHTVSVGVRPDGIIQSANPAFARYLDLPREELIGRELSAFLAPQHRTSVRSWVDGGALPDEPTWINFVARDGSPITLRCVVGPSDEGVRIVGEPELGEERRAAEELMRLNNELATMARERARRERELERVRAELQSALDDLRTSYWHLQKIQEYLPVCMDCGKVKAQGARWQTIVDYLRENEIFMSHGSCPECEAAKLAEWGLE